MAPIPRAERLGTTRWPLDLLRGGHRVGPIRADGWGLRGGPVPPQGYLPRHRLYIRAPLCSSNCRDYTVRVNVLATLLRSRTDCAPCTRARTQRHKSTNTHPTEKPEANTGPLEGGGELGGAPGRIYAIAPFYAQACKARALYIAHFAFSHPLRTALSARTVHPKPGRTPSRAASGMEPTLPRTYFHPKLKGWCHACRPNVATFLPFSHRLRIPHASVHKNPERPATAS